MMYVITVKPNTTKMSLQLLLLLFQQLRSVMFLRKEIT